MNNEMATLLDITPMAGSIGSTMGSAESLAFLPALIFIADLARQRAAYDLVVRESFSLELKLQRCTRTLNAIGTPGYAELSPVWGPKQQVLQDIREIDGIIS